MPLIDLDHYFVRARDLEASRRFYCDVLGLEVMPRPTFPFPGYWLGVNGRIQVHTGPAGSPEAQAHCLGTTSRSADDNSGVVDHIAFRAADPEAFMRRFRAIGLTARRRYFADIRLFQLFVKDPDGLSIELNFPGVAVEPALEANDGIRNGA